MRIQSIKNILMYRYTTQVILRYIITYDITWSNCTNSFDGTNCTVVTVFLEDRIRPCVRACTAVILLITEKYEERTIIP